jgi:hypothetical protein
MVVFTYETNDKTLLCSPETRKNTHNGIFQLRHFLVEMAEFQYL